MTRKLWLFGLIVILGACVIIVGVVMTRDTMNRETGLTKDIVTAWIQEHGVKKNDYYVDGLSFAEMNIDGDTEDEVLVRIDGGVHLGDFFIFDKQAQDSYTLLFEQPWHVESWRMENYQAEGIGPFLTIITRTGGSGIDLREAHLMYMSDSGVWIEAWQGVLKDRSAFQDNVTTTMGSYQFNDDTGELYYWQTEKVTSLEENKQIGDATTSMTIFQLHQGKYVKKE